ncbi:MAG: nitrogen regulation protein NR(II) [Myxococcota bacterium]
MAVADAAFGRWVLGSMGSGVVAIDSDRTIVMINDGARRILGCPGPEEAPLVGLDCREALACQPAVARLLEEAIDARSPLSRAELVLEAPGERERSTIGFTLSPVQDDDGRTRGATMIFRDLTPFERMDEQDRLRERLSALGEMAADLAHEIRNPLAGMQVIADLLKRRLANRPDEVAMVDQIIGELGSVADTVTASLEFVRPVSLERRPLDVVVLIEEAIAVAQSRVAFAGAIVREFEDDVPAVSADPDQLRSVLTNLVLNAFEAMGGAEAEPEQCLTVSVRRVLSDRDARSMLVRSDGQTARCRELVTSEVLIDVADTGPGVPAELREKVFYPFFTTKPHGSGVGLAAAQKIVASHGGLIEIDGREGVGARFRVRLLLGGLGGPDRTDVSAETSPGAAPRGGS